ncbi:hypothetical protein VPH35_087954 [Triticum aestivum]|uniref:uncharacterized protein n=1 Tax=Triticum aestivum TaxID=4565 RepID=UPI001D026C83|nr:uncharacterized protein LOC123115549 [Triticum aestivum]XP_044392619.1 uncharacterized protein LOC123115549 [Triticum aestivum]
MDSEKMQMASRPATAYPEAAWLVSAWTLSTACLFLLTSALVETLDHFDVDIPCSPSWWSVLRCVELTDAGAAKVAAAGSAMRIGMLWRAAPQAAAAALALLLPCRYRQARRALDCLALALPSSATTCTRAPVSSSSPPA